MTVQVDVVVIESKVSFGDTLRLGFVDVKLVKGSGKASAPSPTAFEASEATDAEATLVDILK